MERSTILGCIAPCHLAQERRDKLPASCLFPAFSSGAKLQLLRPNQRIRWDLNLELASSEPKDSNSQPSPQFGNRW